LRCHNQDFRLVIIQSDIRSAQVVPILTHYVRHHDICMVPWGFLLGHVPMYADRQSLEPYETGSLHCFEAVSLG